MTRITPDEAKAMLVRCDRTKCAPKRMRREGADHHGIDLFVRCGKCGREGPYVECRQPTPEARRIVDLAWRDDLQTQKDR